MDEYIKRQDAIEAIKNSAPELVYYNRDEAIDAVNAVSAADVAPVRRGEWVVQKCEGVCTIFRCSECGRTVEVSNDYFGAPTKHTSKIYPYCHCGAYMGGADNAAD